MENYLDIKRKYEQGTVAEYDLIRADVTVKNTEPNLLQAENSLTLAKWQLKALLGMDLDLNIDCDGQLTDFKVQPLRRLSIHGYNLIREYGLETIRPSGGTAEKDAGHAEIRLSAVPCR